MSDESYTMLDPTSETSALLRERVAPPADLTGRRVGLLSIAKERSDEFLDRVAEQLSGAGHDVRRFRKPTHTKPAPEAVLQDVVAGCDVVAVALAD